jgi:hypothetical protein
MDGLVDLQKYVSSQISTHGRNNRHDVMSIMDMGMDIMYKSGQRSKSVKWKLRWVEKGPSHSAPQCHFVIP